MTTTGVTMTATTTRATTEPWHRRRPGFRLRVFGVIAVVLVLSGAAALLLQRAVLRASLDRRIDRAHDQEVTELQSLATGRNPATGRPFAGDVEAVFDTFLARNVPAEDEVYVTLIDGRPHLSSRAEVRLDADPDLVAEWSAITQGARGRVETEAGPVRWIAAPLMADGEVAGVFVVATFLDDEHRDIDATIRAEALVALLAVVVALGVAWAMAGRLLQPVRDLTENAQALEQSDLSARIPEEGGGEIARLARTYNSMLDRLQGAFETQRRFVDDAGHELRTPITIIGGHLELMGDDPDERRETIALVTDELDRMARIVDDLLVLARAEQPDFVHPEPTDLAALTAGLLDRASAMGNRTWVADGSAAGVAALDGQRITQAALNLVRNAVEHTVDGALVGIGSAVVDDHLHLWVRDSGPGVPPEERARLFDRFARGAGRRRSEGAGLGLAIVAAIAEAHHGRVELADPPGGGAVFTLMVPLPPAPDPEEASWPAS